MKDPKGSPKEAALLLGMILVLVLIVLLLVAIFLVKAPKKPRKTEEKKGASAHKTLAFLEVLFVLFLTGMSAALIFTSQPLFCKSCHIMRPEISAWKKSTHKSVGCLACHQNPGTLGYISERGHRIKEAVSYATKSYEKPILASVANAACRQCHKVEEKTLTRRTIKVSHKEIMEGGYKCVDCHNTVAHEEVILQKKYPTMEKCMMCHNNRRVSARCSLCHVSDVGKKAREVADYPKVRLEPPTDCKGCHSITKCTECHGIEMPHPEDWKTKHPRDAFVNKKACWKCHDMQFCQGCHPRMPWPHPDDFPKTHGEASKQPGSCGCHIRETFCAVCH